MVDLGMIVMEVQLRIKMEEIDCVNVVVIEENVQENEWETEIESLIVTLTEVIEEDFVVLKGVTIVNEISKGNYLISV
jgi:hypothetical protein